MSDYTPELMAARLKQIARDEKRVTANAARRGLRATIREAEKGFASGSSIGKKLWGDGFWRGQAHSQKSLGIRRNSRGMLVGSAKSLRLYSRARDAARKAFQAAGGGIPLIVRNARSGWSGDVWRGGVISYGVAGNLERGVPFKAHRQGKGRHPGGPVPHRPALEPALQHNQAAMSRAIQEDVGAFIAQGLD